MKIQYILFFCTMLLLACKPNSKTTKSTSTDTTSTTTSDIDKLLDKYVPFTLTTDVSALSAKEKEMIKILIKASDIMNDLFWYEAYGDKDEFLASIKDPKQKEYAMINYGPWDRLNGNAPFIEGVGAKPLGANYYPADMTKKEFENSKIKDKADLYTFVKRGKGGDIMTIPYHAQFSQEVKQVSELLLDAAKLSEDAGLTKYLKLRAAAMLDDDYQASDMAWLDMKTNHIDVVIGPIETYEDQLFGYKAAHEGYVLVKDMEWSEKLAKYAQFLPDLQTGLPVPDAYKAEEPGRDTELNAYDVVYYAGDCNAGSKTIAINLPNDEEVQLKKGTRRLQLKNAMRAKFDKILTPIADMLIDDQQRKHITFDAFFSNTMFHEVAHGLGIKNTLDGKGTVRKALKEHASAIEEGKADMLGLYMINQLHKKGEIQGDLKDYIVTFMTSIFRSVRFGASSAHGKANMIRFNYFDEMGAFTRDEKSGKYKINFDKFDEATNALSTEILILQGDGDYDKVSTLIANKASIKGQLKNDLERLAEAGIPVDVVFNQGVDILGL